MFEKYTPCGVTQELWIFLERMFKDSMTVDSSGVVQGYL